MSPRTRRLGKAAAGLALAIAVAAGGAATWLELDRDGDPSLPDVQTSPALVARGAYVARAADCVACHTVPGGRSFAGGLAFALPFGTIHSTNITSDRETGIGTWSDDDFVRALHHGVAKDGTHLYPAFPYTSYTGMAREDAVALKAYLFSLPAVHAPAVGNSLSFPFDQRWTMALWNLVFLNERRFRPDPRLTDRENRGAYLASALGHCGECHTPRNLAFALGRRQFAGAVVEGWHAYNITSDARSGIGGWNDQELSAYLRTGHADGRGSASGPMGEAVSKSLQYLSTDDTDALVAYLRRVPPQQGEAGSGADAATVPMSASPARAPGMPEGRDDLGRRVFEGACASCHRLDGEGRQTPYAALAGSQAANDPTGTNLVQVLLGGADLQAVHRSVFMPSFGKAFTDQELAAVANYVIGHFGDKAGEVSPDQVQAARRID